MNIPNNCMRKQRLTEDEARAIVARLRYRKSYAGICAFKCKTCKTWHTGKGRRR